MHARTRTHACTHPHARMHAPTRTRTHTHTNLNHTVFLIVALRIFLFIYLYAAHLGEYFHIVLGHYPVTNSNGTLCCYNKLQYKADTLHMLPVLN